MLEVWRYQLNIVQKYTQNHFINMCLSNSIQQEHLMHIKTPEQGASPVPNGAHIVPINPDILIYHCTVGFASRLWTQSNTASISNRVKIKRYKKQLYHIHCDKCCSSKEWYLLTWSTGDINHAFSGRIFLYNLLPVAYILFRKGPNSANDWLIHSFIHSFMREHNGVMK